MQKKTISALFFLFMFHIFVKIEAQSSPIILGYFPSWSETSPESDNPNTKLRQIPSYVNYVFLGFAKPEMRYTKGSYNISQTGIEVPYGGCELKESVSALKAKGVNVILSVGGQSYWTNPNVFSSINYQQIKDLVDDMGFVGIDWDFEPNGTFEDIGNSTNTQHFIDFFVNSRNIMPRSEGYILACAPAGVGALGGENNNDSNSPYKYENRNTLTGENDTNLYNIALATNGINLFGMKPTGHMIPVIKAVGNEIDIIAPQAYNTGGSSNRTIMYDAYAYYAETYGFKIAFGTHFPDEPWGPYYKYTLQDIAKVSEHIKNYPSRKGDNDGLMIWQLLLENSSENSSAYSYLNVASKILNGSTTANAIANANDFTLTPYTGGAAGCSATEGPQTYCGALEYDVTKNYGTPNTKVFYQCKIWKNKWWANPNEVPGSNNVWEFVSNCSEGTGCSTLGTNENNVKSNTNIYVNNGFLYFKSPNNTNTPKDIIIYDMNGRIMGNYKKIIDKVNISQFKTGLYIVKVIFPDGNAIKTKVRFL